ncbi:hypothetical protein [Cryobacterium sp. CG_9.6]|uniref:hypothetical protein n=1 Tax=Cryobacterium sp. CG_9.6 TaxID=2760710 RepID=UPI002473494E|nr:hypothetical protein [Cryobacterium sp. CG_9.6]MDH6235891.1 hypothetical protein [Cryobacterium sp. CG_9.6]
MDTSQASAPVEGLCHALRSRVPDAPVATSGNRYSSVVTPALIRVKKPPEQWIS